jgi:hypothetical protein
MSETPPPISPQHQGTFLAVNFVLTLLALAFTLYTSRQVGEVASVVGALERADSKQETAMITKQGEEIAALKKRLDAMSAAAAPAAPPAPPAPPAAPPAAPTPATP